MESASPGYDPIIRLVLPRPLPRLASRLAIALFVRTMALEPGAALAVTPPQGWDRPAFTARDWHPEHGLPHSTIEELAASADGYLWVGTPQGLVRFDGVAFTPVRPAGVTDPFVDDLHPAPDGTMWAAFRDGTVVRLDRDRVVERLPPLGRDRLRNLVQGPGGELWLATESGEVLSIASGQIRAALPGLTGVRIVAVDRRGALWAAGGGRLTRRDPDGSVLTEALPNECDVFSLLAEDDEVWVGTSCGLVSRGSAGAMRVLRTTDGLSSDRVRTLARAEDGALWIGGVAGVDRLGPEGTRRFGAADGLQSLNVFSLHAAPGGILWVGTANGLARLRPARFRMLSARDGLLGDAVRTLAETSDGALWIGTGVGLARLRDGHLESFRPDGHPGLTAESILSLLAARDGSLWIGLREAGIVRWRGGTFVPMPFPRQSVQVLLETTDGTLWAGTRDRGLARITDDGVRWIGPDAGLPGPDVRALAPADAGGLWVGTNAGLAHLEGLAVTRTVGAADGLPAGPVMALSSEAAGDLWIGTEAGLALLRAGRVRRYTEDEGVPAEPVLQILDDRDGRLWLCTRRGVVRLDRNELDALDRSAVPFVSAARFGADDGLLASACHEGSQPAALRTRDGGLWFATVGGVAMAHPERPGPSPPPPRIEIRHVRRDDRVATVTAGGSVAVAAGTGDIEIGFAVIAPGAPEKHPIRFRLDGVDPTWRLAEGHAASYHDLGPGVYTLRAVTTDGEGRWAREGTMLALQVLPRAYQTGWFWAVLAALATALAAVGTMTGHRLRQRHHRARFQAVLAERGRLAREIHDTLDQDLLATGLQLDAAARRLADRPEEARRHLELARQFIADSQDETRRLVWELRALMLERDGDLPGALKAMVRRLNEGGGVRAEITVEGQPRPLPPAVESGLLRLAQEAATNAARHAEARTIAVCVSYESRRVRLRIEDDGRGFDASRAGEATFGLGGMQERAATLGATLRIDSQPGAGTRIEVEAPTP